MNDKHHRRPNTTDDELTDAIEQAKLDVACYGLEMQQARKQLGDAVTLLSDLQGKRARLKRLNYRIDKAWPSRPELQALYDEALEDHNKHNDDS